ncbi:hypothetical protein [Spongiactinospora sp. TRM90649]|uniref:hypothetical protein n=1 Tax=Spongiactinospora sp. TRM90649 TaxID=3031114 RepID=UPI0023F7BED3|nr:hypothetical protein [Spongiactinospora sp. TRM90649]MDF5751580.1 hypothetical protein [Spongiactinospora sp. TRM90649]
MRSPATRILAVAVLAAVAVILFLLGRDLVGRPVQVSTAGEHYAVTALISPIDSGTSRIEVLLNSGEADAVTVSAVMPAMGHAMPEIAARRAAPGRFLAEGELFSMPGAWQLTVRVSGRAGEEVLTVSAVIEG